MLNSYLMELQGLIRDRAQKYMNPEDLRGYVNRSRREIAMRTQSIRRVPPISASILSIQVTNAGANYTDPTVIISAPDSPSGLALNPGGLLATATAQLVGGQISNISVTNGGDGYYQPDVTIVDPTGSGATATATVSPISTLNPYQENYRYSDIDLTIYPGVGPVFAVLGCSSIFSNLRYSWVYKSFSEYQALIRNYPRQYYYTPAVFTQYGQGVDGTLLCYPIPSQSYLWEPDCLCLPVDLEDDSTFEALPQPWTDAVVFRAASLAFQEMQNYNVAKFYQEQFDLYTNRYSQYARNGRVRSWYGRA